MFDWLRQPHVAFIAIGVLFLIAGVAWLIGTILFLRRAREADAEIVALELRDVRQHSGGTVRRWFIVVKFTDSKGHEHSHAFGGGSLRPSFEVGQTVRVHFDPRNPLRVLRQGFTGVWLAPIVVCVLGITVIMGGILLSNRG